MINFKHILISTILFTQTLVWAENITIPDSSFRNYLVKNHPSVMNTDSSLNSVLANDYLATLELSNIGVENLEGIQHFRNVTAIQADSNQINDLTPLLSLTGLEILSLSSNEIELLPDFSTFNSLVELNVSYNSITEFPQFSETNSLQKLNLEGNEITVIPDISRLSNLEVLNLRSVYFESTPDFSSLSQLRILDIGNNKLDSSPDLGSLSLLQELYIDNNEFKDIPDGIKNLSELTLAKFESNYFSLNDLTEIYEIDRFESIFTLVPQKDFNLQNEYNKTAGESIRLRTDNDASVDGVYYELYKNNKLLASNNTGTFSFDNITTDFAGTYRIYIKSTSYPSIYRQSNYIFVSVDPCIDEAEIEVLINHVDCKGLGSIEITTNLEISSFEITNKSYSTNSDSGHFSDLEKAKYILTLTKGTCSHTYTNELEVSKVSCEEILLTPDNDGLDEFVHLDHDGKIEILNKNGVHVGELQGPIDWDGSANSSLLPIGVYYLKFSDSDRFRIISLVY